VNIVTWRGSINATSDGRTIRSLEPIVVYREQGWLDRLRAWLRSLRRRGAKYPAIDLTSCV